MFRSKKSVETITAKLRDTVEELRAHAGHQHGEGNEKHATAERLHSEAKEHHAEMDRALKVASNIEALLQ